ncbi:MAG: hypothetical protein FWD28_07105 [Treponema sp.]|nr:hypothetical protein [Treponema sp.]
MKNLLGILMILAMLVGSAAILFGQSAMPDWVNEVPEETDAVMYFVTSGGKDGTTSAKATDALSLARAELAQYLAGTTEQLIRNYTERVGSGDNVQTLQRLQNGIINRAVADTSGLRRRQQWTAPDGEYWGLYTYDKTVFVRAIRAEVAAYNRSPEAAAATINSDEFFAEMQRTLSP